MLGDGTLRGLALHHLEVLDCYEVGEAPERDREIQGAVRAAVSGLPWITRIPVRLVLEGAGVWVRVRTRSDLDRLERSRRAAEARALRGLPLVPLADKLVLNITYLRALGVHPGAGETTP